MKCYKDWEEHKICGYHRSRKEKKNPERAEKDWEKQVGKRRNVTICHMVLECTEKLNFSLKFSFLVLMKHFLSF